MTQFIQPPKLGEDIQNLIDAINTDIVDRIGIPKDIDILQPKEKFSSIIAIEHLQQIQQSRQWYLNAIFEIHSRFLFRLIGFIQRAWERGDPLTELPQILGHLGILKWEETDGTHGTTE